MNEAQRKKRNFRASKKWKLFQHTKKVEQDGKCFITGKKLTKTANLHHCDLNEDHYTDTSKPENFVYLSYNMHQVVHMLWVSYKNDPSVLDRLKEVMERMLRINTPPFENENN